MSTELQDIDGKEGTLADYMNNKKAVIVVNVASKWGKTAKYYRSM